MSNTEIYLSFPCLLMFMYLSLSDEPVSCDDVPPPEIQGASFTHNGSHVTYQCNTDYAFTDGQRHRVYRCSQASLAPLDPCLSK